jgi:hypothetical protein
MMAPTTPCMTTGRTLAPCTDILEAAIAITTHHDGLSGTEKQAVSDDYAQRMSRGEDAARGLVAEALQVRHIPPFPQAHPVLARF